MLLDYEKEEVEKQENINQLISEHFLESSFYKKIISINKKLEENKIFFAIQDYLVSFFEMNEKKREDDYRAIVTILSISVVSGVSYFIANRPTGLVENIGMFLLYMISALILTGIFLYSLFFILIIVSFIMELIQEKYSKIRTSHLLKSTYNSEQLMVLYETLWQKHKKMEKENPKVELEIRYSKEDHERYIDLFKKHIINKNPKQYEMFAKLCYILDLKRIALEKHKENNILEENKKISLNRLENLDRKEILKQIFEKTS